MYCLTHRQRSLVNEKTVDHYNIRRGAMVNMIARKIGTLELYAKRTTTRTKLEVDMWETVGKFKQAIMSKRIYWDRELIFGGNMLGDNRYILSYGIPNKYTFELHIVHLEIFCRGLFGKVTLLVEENDTVQALKAKIAENVIRLPKEIQLIYEESLLEDVKMLCEYKIKSIIYMIDARYVTPSYLPCEKSDRQV